MRSAFVIALALVAVLLTTGSTGQPPSETLRGSLAGEEVRLTTPGEGIEPKGLVVWFHGQGGNVNDRIDGPWLDALRREGYAIASSNFHAQSWGNPASTRDAELLVDWAEEKTGLPVTLWVSGSMGGSVSLNALIHGVKAPNCWYGVKPAIALTEMDEVPGGPGFIYKAFAGQVPPDRNPVANVGSLPVSVRYRIVASRGDQWVIFKENAGPLSSGLRERGADVTQLIVEGFHDDPSHFNARDLVAYADSCLDEAPRDESAQAG